MGRLTMKEVEDLQRMGTLDTNTIAIMIERGLVGQRKRRKEPAYVLNNDGKKVYPALTFKEHGKGNKDSQVMTKIRDEFNNIITKYKENSNK